MQKNISKIKKISKKLLLFIGLLFTLLIITIGSYYYFNRKPQTEATKEIKKTKTLKKNVLCEKENNELNCLEVEIKTLEEELKTKSNLTPEYKTNLEQIIKKQQDKKTNLKNFINFKFYMNHLETEIKEYDKELKTIENSKEDASIVKKHNLTEKKLDKEKELLSLQKKQKLFPEKDELQNHILKDLTEKLKKTDLTPADKITLETKQAEIEKRITEINKEINYLVNTNELKNNIDNLTKEIETEKDEALKQLLMQRKEICQQQLKTLN
jgi:hypothetical protein